MGKSKKNRENKRRKKSQTAVPSASNTTEAEIDGKKVTKGSEISTDEIQATGNFPQIVTQGTDFKEGINILTEDIKVAEQSSHRKELVMTNKEIKKMVEDIEKTMAIDKFIFEMNSNTMAGNISSTQYQDRPNSFVESHQDLYKFLKSRHPKLFENTEICKSLNAEHKRIQKVSNTLHSLKEMSEAEAFQVLETLKEVAYDTDEQISAATVAKIKDGDNGITTDLGKDEGKKVGTNDGDSSVDDIQNATHSTKKLTVEEKDGNGSTDNIQETEKDPHNMELEHDGEALMKIIDAIDGSTVKAKDGFEMKHTNEMVNVCPRQNKSYEISFQVLQRKLKEYFTSQRSKSDKDMDKFRRIESSLKVLKEKLDLLSSEKEKEITLGNAKALEEIKASKEQAYQIEEIIIELQKLEGQEYDSYTDYIKVAGQSPQNAADGKKKGKKGNEDIDRSKDDIKDFHSDKEMLTPIQEIEDGMRKHNKNEAIYSEKTEIFPVGDFQRGLKEFMTLQKSKVDEQVKKHRDMGSELMFTKEQRDIFSLEKGFLTTVSKIESHKENKVTTHLEDEEIEEVVTIAQLYDEPNEIIIDLGKNENIRFEFETNGNKHIFVGKKHYYSSSEEKQNVTFNFKDKSIQVSFTDNQVSVSTQNSEFDISVRKSNPVNLTDEATQTDTLP